MKTLEQSLVEALHQRDALMQAILKTATDIGLCNSDGVITGPHLLMFCDDFTNLFLDQSAQIAELQAKILELQPNE